MGAHSARPPQAFNSVPRVSLEALRLFSMERSIKAKPWPLEYSTEQTLDGSTSPWCIWERGAWALRMAVPSDTQIGVRPPPPPPTASADTAACCPHAVLQAACVKPILEHAFAIPENLAVPGMSILEKCPCPCWTSTRSTDRPTARPQANPPDRPRDRQPARQPATRPPAHPPTRSRAGHPLAQPPDRLRLKALKLSRASSLLPSCGGRSALPLALLASCSLALASGVPLPLLRRLSSGSSCAAAAPGVRIANADSMANGDPADDMPCAEPMTAAGSMACAHPMACGADQRSFAEFVTPSQPGPPLPGRPGT